MVKWREEKRVRTYRCDDEGALQYEAQEKYSQGSIFLLTIPWVG